MKYVDATPFLVPFLVPGWTWGVVQGDFNEEATIGQIATNAIVTAIPGVDQVGDARDLIANLKLLIWDKRYNDGWVWFALFLTLVGLVPTVGSLLKGALKLIWKGTKLGELLRVFNYFMKGNGILWFKTLRDGKLLSYADEAARYGRQILDSLSKTLTDLKGKIPQKFQNLHARINGTLSTVNEVKARINGQFDDIARQLSKRLGMLLDEAAENTVSGASRRTLKQQQRAVPPPRRFKRIHPDGPEGDPFTLLADGKPMGTDVGKVPSELKGLDDLPTNHDQWVKKGWPSLDEEYQPNKHARDYRNFTDAVPDELEPGTKIYRVIDEGTTELKDGVSGCYWTTELPKNKAEWRRDYAVKDSWNDNGYYIEDTVGPEGLKVWRGGAAAQEYRKTDYYLRGGREQIFVQRGAVKDFNPKLTNWPDA